MSAYVIGNIHVTNPERYQEYSRQVPAIIQRHGGRYLVRGGHHEPLEGDWGLDRVVVIEFPSIEQARAFYHSPEYQAIAGIRLASSEGVLAVVEGVPQGAGQAR